jgi:hypothetical protein
MKEIPLTKGYIALVDDADFERVVAAGPWTAAKRIGHGARTVYAQRHTLGTKGRKTIYLHRFILELPIARFPKVDHWNHNGLDCRRRNLRITNDFGNQHNRQKCLSIEGRPTTSKFKGVSWWKSNRAWVARIADGKGGRIFLGNFSCEETAAHAYDAKAVELFGEFAHLNFPHHWNSCTPR